MQTMETKGFFQFEIIIYVLILLYLSDSFKYLCYGSTAIINIFTLTVQGSTLVIRIWRLQDRPRCKGESTILVAPGFCLAFGVTFSCGRKKSEIIQILLSHSPPYGDVQVTFSRFYWNSKWPPRINFNFLVGAKTQKISLVNFFKFYHHIPSNMCMCNWFFKDSTNIQNDRQK